MLAGNVPLTFPPTHNPQIQRLVPWLDKVYKGLCEPGDIDEPIPAKVSPAALGQRLAGKYGAKPCATPEDLTKIVEMVAVSCRPVELLEVSYSQVPKRARAAGTQDPLQLLAVDGPKILGEVQARVNACFAHAFAGPFSVGEVSDTLSLAVPKARIALGQQSPISATKPGSPGGVSRDLAVAGGVQSFLFEGEEAEQYGAWLRSVVLQKSTKRAATRNESQAQVGGSKGSGGNRNPGPRGPPKPQAEKSSGSVDVKLQGIAGVFRLVRWLSVFLGGSVQVGYGSGVLWASLRVGGTVSFFPVSCSYRYFSNTSCPPPFSLPLPTPSEHGLGHLPRVCCEELQQRELLQGRPQMCGPFSSLVVVHVKPAIFSATRNTNTFSSAMLFGVQQFAV